MDTKIYKTKIIVTDNVGKVILEKEVSMDVVDGNIDYIESSVTKFRHEVLKDLTNSILEEEQQCYIKKA